jgi:hypothetical protein
MRSQTPRIVLLLLLTGSSRSRILVLIFMSRKIVDVEEDDVLWRSCTTTVANYVRGRRALR